MQHIKLTCVQEVSVRPNTKVPWHQLERRQSLLQWALALGDPGRLQGSPGRGAGECQRLARRDRGPTRPWQAWLVSSPAPPCRVRWCPGSTCELGAQPTRPRYLDGQHGQSGGCAAATAQLLPQALTCMPGSSELQVNVVRCSMELNQARTQEHRLSSDVSRGWAPAERDLARFSRQRVWRRKSSRATPYGVQLALLALLVLKLVHVGFFGPPATARAPTRGGALQAPK